MATLSSRPPDQKTKKLIGQCRVPFLILSLFPFALYFCFKGHYSQEVLILFILFYLTSISVFLHQAHHHVVALIQLKEAHNKIIQTGKLSALGQIAGEIAHEINNPVMIINGNAHVIKSLASKEKMDQARVITAATNIETMVARITKITQGIRSLILKEQAPNSELISVKQLVEDALTFCHYKMKRYSIDLQISPIPETLFLWCRPTALSQVILNLVNNACDALQGKSERWIRLECAESGEHLLISITDSGGGIQQEMQGRLMQPFFTTKKNGKGLGLGLSISKKIVEDHGGTLFLDPAAAHTKFTVKMPKNQIQNKIERLQPTV